MKLFVYSYRAEDEELPFRRWSRETGIPFAASPLPPSAETADLAAGAEAVSTFLTPIDRATLERWAVLGVRYLAIRSTGYDGVNLRDCRTLGFRVGHALYPPQAVAHYALTLMLLLLRKLPETMRGAAVEDFSLRGKLGRDLSSCTLGVIGTGRIGQTLARSAGAIGARVLGYDPYPAREAEEWLTYVPLEGLFRNADVISLHSPSTPETRHLISRAAFRQMKDGVLLVNTARGDLIDTEALIDALEVGKVGGAALDVLEEETGLCYRNLSGVPLKNRSLALLRSFPNVVLTPHIAFYTAESVEAMTESVFAFLHKAGAGQPSVYEITDAQ